MSDHQVTENQNMMITLENVNKWYGQFHVLKDINLSVKPRERIVLCGPSGSGNQRPSVALTIWKSTSKGASWWTEPN